MYILSLMDGLYMKQWMYYFTARAQEGTSHVLHGSHVDPGALLLVTHIMKHSMGENITSWETAATY